MEPCHDLSGSKCHWERAQGTHCCHLDADCMLGDGCPVSLKGPSDQMLGPQLCQPAQFLCGIQQSKDLLFSSVKDTGLHKGRRQWMDCLSRMLQGKGRQGCSARSAWYHPVLASLPAPSCLPASLAAQTFLLKVSSHSELLRLGPLDSL